MAGASKWIGGSPGAFLVVVGALAGPVACTRASSPPASSLPPAQAVESEPEEPAVPLEERVFRARVERVDGSTAEWGLAWVTRIGHEGILVAVTTHHALAPRSCAEHVGTEPCRYHYDELPEWWEVEDRVQRLSLLSLSDGGVVATSETLLTVENAQLLGHDVAAAVLGSDAAPLVLPLADVEPVEGQRVRVLARVEALPERRFHDALVEALPMPPGDQRITAAYDLVLSDRSVPQGELTGAPVLSEDGRVVGMVTEWLTCQMAGPEELRGALQQAVYIYEGRATFEPSEAARQWVDANRVLHRRIQQTIGRVSAGESVDALLAQLGSLEESIREEAERLDAAREALPPAQRIWAIRTAFSEGIAAQDALLQQLVRLMGEAFERVLRDAGAPDAGPPGTGPTPP